MASPETGLAWTLALILPQRRFHRVQCGQLRRGLHLDLQVAVTHEKVYLSMSWERFNFIGSLFTFLLICAAFWLRDRVCRA